MPLISSLEEHSAEVRAMDLSVAHCAGLVFSRLVVNRAAGRNSCRKAVTLQAQHVHYADFQQSRIGGTMRRVATAATVRFHRHMLVDERSLLVGVALVADCISAGQVLCVAQRRGAVRVMAVGASHQPFLDAVVIRLGEIRLFGRVAAVAKLGLVFYQQMFFLLRVMRRVAIEASNLAAGMRGLAEVGLLVAVAVATQAAGACLAPRVFAEDKYFALVATPRHMVAPRPVTAFAALLGGASVRIEAGLPVRGLRPGVVE